MQRLIAHIDGAARGNPGPAAIGIFLMDEQKKEIESVAETIGIATNNEAEYHALLRGLELGAKHRATEIEIRTDSRLLASQVNGNYRVHAPNLKPLYARAKRAMKKFVSVSIHHVPREQNRRADALANRALDQAQKVKS